MHGRVSRTAENRNLWVLEIAVPSRDAVEASSEGEESRTAERTVAAEGPPPTARLIEGGSRIVNAARPRGRAKFEAKFHVPARLNPTRLD